MTEHDSPTVDETAEQENVVVDESVEGTEESVPEQSADASAEKSEEESSANDDGEEKTAIEKHVDVVLIKRVLEGAILAADSPLDRDAMLMLFDEEERPNKKALDEILEALAEDYADRGIQLREVSSGFRFQVRTEMGPWVSRMWQEKPPRYSRAILETLALIAYRQPITRGEIEEIRGVTVNTQIVRTLLERNWVRIVGHRDVPGRPAMYATTKGFLDYFNLQNLEDLPPLSEIKDLDKINEELQLEDKKVADAVLAIANADKTQAEGAEGDENRQASIIDAINNNEPEIDESTLMSLEKVDQVLSGFEAEFRKKPQAKDAEEEPTPDMLEQDISGDDEIESENE
ncbi:MAG: SMC-Scp complex subunit ScpB [Alcanivoracaceae bacterium]|nr:SMC-Scp complex subunit ScpB [Alcanivoracaceae bacterium]